MAEIEISEKRCSSCGIKRDDVAVLPSLEPHESGLLRPLCRRCRGDSVQRDADRKASEKRKRRVDRRADRLSTNYGLRVGARQRMRERQGDACAICREPFGEKTPHLDHDHSTGRPRGLLCSFCNTGLGLFRESPERLIAAAEFLRDQARRDRKSVV